MKRPRLGWPVIASPPSDAAPARLRTRMLWMAGIWAASVLLLLSVGGILRLVLKAA